MQDKTGKAKEDKADLAQAVKARDLLMLRDTDCNNIQTYNKNLLAGWRTCRGLVPQNLMNTWLLYAVQLKVVEESQCALDAMVWFSNLIRKKKHVTTNDFCSRWITLISMLTAKWTWTQRWVRVHWGFKVQTTLICCSFLKIHWNGAGPYPLTTAISRTFCKASSERGPHPDEAEAWMYMHEFIENRGSKTIHEPWKFIDHCCVPSIENRTSKKQHAACQTLPYHPALLEVPVHKEVSKVESEDASNKDTSKVESKVESTVESKVESKVESTVESKVESKDVSGVEPKVEPKDASKDVSVDVSKDVSKVESKVESKGASKDVPKIELQQAWRKTCYICMYVGTIKGFKNLCIYGMHSWTACGLNMRLRAIFLIQRESACFLTNGLDARLGF